MEEMDETGGLEGCEVAKFGVRASAGLSSMLKKVASGLDILHHGRRKGENRKFVGAVCGFRL
ncbi:MAG: hypothetical protein IPM21_01995 [Acidobacteria bacterium]|nr:hypothetical protein [Acidobacteriota bacterium]